MKKFVALLRGINVGGHKKIKMADLRVLLEENGLSNVSTYIQSGNVLFRSAQNRSELEKLIAQSILNQYGFEVPVIVRPASAFAKLISGNPISGATPNHLSVMLLQSKPPRTKVDSIPDLESGDDQYVVIKDAIYIHCPNGIARSKLTIGFFEKHLGTTATARNWKSINKLASLAAEM